MVPAAQVGLQLLAGKMPVADAVGPPQLRHRRWVTSALAPSGMLRGRSTQVSVCRKTDRVSGALVEAPGEDEAAWRWRESSSAAAAIASSAIPATVMAIASHSQDRRAGGVSARVGAAECRGDGRSFRAGGGGCGAGW